MSVTEKIMEVIDEVLDEREKEAILSVLDSADEIDFDKFFKTKNYDIIGKKGLTSYSSYKLVAAPPDAGLPWHRIPEAEKLNHVYIDGGALGRRGATRLLRSWETHGGYDKGHRPMGRYTVRNRLKSAFEKLEKSPKLRAINAFSS